MINLHTSLKPETEGNVTVSLGSSFMLLYGWILVEELMIDDQDSLIVIHVL
jgi:hypothetical protein